MKLPIQAKPVARKSKTANRTAGLKSSQLACEESCKHLYGAARALCIEMCQY
jgi:hypothetical protein